MLLLFLNTPASELRALTTIGAIVSLLSCLFILLSPRLLLSRSSSSSAASFHRSLSFPAQIIWYLALAGGIEAGSYLVYRVDASAAEYAPDGSITRVAALCRIQAGLMQFGGLASMLWAAIGMLNTYLTVFLYESHPQKFHMVYLLVGFFLPLCDTVALAPWLLDYYGPTDLWCWIGSENHRLAGWVHFYFPLAIMSAACWAGYWIVASALRARLSGERFGFSRTASASASAISSSGSANGVSVPIMSGGVASSSLVPSTFSHSSSAASLRTTWRTYLLLLLLLRLPGVVHRAYEFMRGDALFRAKQPGALTSDQSEVYFLELLHAIFSPLTGAAALVLFFGNPRMRAAWKHKWEALRGNGGAAAAAIISSTVGGGSGGSATGGGYRSLADAEHDSVNSHGAVSSASSAASAASNSSALDPIAPNIQSIFPPAVWARLNEKARNAGQHSKVEFPPVKFQAFPIRPSQRRLPYAAASTASAAGNASGSKHIAQLRCMIGSWNQGESLPPFDQSHPSFDRASILERHGVLPTDASASLLNSWLPSGSAADDFDLIVVGVQESSYDPLMERSQRRRQWCGWRDEAEGVPSTERHWFEVVRGVVNRGRDGDAPPVSSASSSSSSSVVDTRPFHTVGGISLGMIRLLVLCHPRLASEIHDIHTAVEAAGLGSVYKNKGGCAISFRVGIRRFSFVNTHLAALDGFEDDRNDDVCQIWARLQIVGGNSMAKARLDSDPQSSFNAPPTHSRSSVRSSLFTLPSSSCTCALELDPSSEGAFHFSAFLGDLNYRFRLPGVRKVQEGSKREVKARARVAYQQVTRAIASGDLAFLRAQDELCRIMLSRRLFVGWKEAELMFPPTYKYRLSLRAALEAHSPGLSSSLPTGIMQSPPPQQHEVDQYDAKRTPAWCDRILYRTAAGVKVDVREYRDVFEVCTSDHKPICGTFDITFDQASRELVSGGGGGTSDGAGGLEEESKESSETLSASSTPPPSASSLPASSPRRRQTASSPSPSSSTTAAAGRGVLSPEEEFLQAHPKAFEVISPHSLKMLNTPSPPITGASGSSVTNEKRSTYRIKFTHLSIYDILDPYGSPLVQPYISFLGEVLCANMTCGPAANSARAGAAVCLRSHTSVAEPFSSSASALLHASQTTILHDPDSFDSVHAGLNQSGPAALAAAGIKVAEWSNGAAGGAEAGEEEEDAMQRVDAVERSEIPVLHTAHRLTRSELQSSSLQLVVKDAYSVGEIDALGCASVDLGAGLMEGGAAAEPVFFVAPILAQTKLIGTMTGHFVVVPV
jgi:hypothetical protein